MPCVRTGGFCSRELEHNRVDRRLNETKTKQKRKLSSKVNVFGAADVFQLHACIEEVYIADMAHEVNCSHGTLHIVHMVP